jgi:anthranilate/para-aminobenzoate synthase component I
MILQTKINDVVTPVAAYLALNEAGLEPMYLLESVEKSGANGRYSFLGIGTSKRIVQKKKQQQPVVSR